MIGQMFHGIDSETLLAIPFFLLVGELMTSADVTQRLIRLAQALVGHLRGGLAQVVTLFSMFFAGISGSSAADVAVLSRTVAPEMDKERYDRAFTAALIASASTIANLIPPSIMAVVYGATGNVSIGGLFLAGIVPGVMIGIGLMIYSYFFGPIGVLKKRASMCELYVAARGSALPMVIPLIIMGGILTGWFTPTEAGMVAAVYILVVLIPLLQPRHIWQLPGDFIYTGLLYSLPLALVAAASAFGWMLAYLRGPDAVADLISHHAGTDPVDDHVPAGAAVHPGRRFHRRGAGHHHLHADHQQADRTRQHQAGAYGRGHHHHAGVRPDHAALRAVPAGGFEIRGRAVQQARWSVRLPLYVVFLFTIGFVVLFPDVVLWLPKQFLPQSVGCFPNPSGAGYICPP